MKHNQLGRGRNQQKKPSCLKKCSSICGEPNRILSKSPNNHCHNRVITVNLPTKWEYLISPLRCPLFRDLILPDGKFWCAFLRMTYQRMPIWGLGAISTCPISTVSVICGLDPCMHFLHAPSRGKWNPTQKTFWRSRMSMFISDFN